jgi:hypothetical protein
MNLNPFDTNTETIQIANDFLNKRGFPDEVIDTIFMMVKKADKAVADNKAMKYLTINFDRHMSEATDKAIHVVNNEYYMEDDGSDGTRFNENISKDCVIFKSFINLIRLILEIQFYIDTYKELNVVRLFLTKINTWFDSNIFLSQDIGITTLAMISYRINNIKPYNITYKTYKTCFKEVVIETVDELIRDIKYKNATYFEGWRHISYGIEVFANIIENINPIVFEKPTFNTFENNIDDI